MLENLLQVCLADPYFKRQPPKSSGKEDFNLFWLQQQLNASNTTMAAPQNILATLTLLTATCIADAIQAYAPQSEVYLCGGGAFNISLRNMLQNIIKTQVATTSELGVDPQWVEAALFAWLAQQNITNNKIDLSKITGATHPVILGAIYKA